MNTRRWMGITVVWTMALVLVASAAYGQNTAERQPLAFALRPLTTPRMTVRGDGALGLNHVSVPPTVVLGMPVGGGSDNRLFLSLGGAFGVTDDLELGASLLNFAGGTGGGLQNPSVYGLYRFMPGAVELAGQLRIALPLAEGSRHFTFELGLPALLRAGSDGRFDTGAFVALTTSDPLGKALRIPVAYSHNINPTIFLGGRTGLSVPDFDFNLASVPLGVFGGYSLGGSGSGGVMADLVLAFDIPFFVTGRGNNTINLDFWQITFAARVFAFL